MSEAEENDARARAIAFIATGRAQEGATSPEDEAQLREVGAFWQGLDGLAQDPRLIAMRAQALARFESPVTARRLWQLPTAGLLAASLVAVVTVTVVRHAPAPSAVAPAPMLAITNGRALPRKVALADGSSATLDSQTSLHVSPDGRRVALDNGRAFFMVRHDPAHPFTVMAGGMVVSDIGTHFEVQQVGASTSVTLVEGKVSVAHGTTAMELSPGQRLTLSGDHMRRDMLDAAHQTLWQTGMISADDLPVSAVIARFNRYLAQPLVLRDPAKGSLRISGEFRLDDPQALAMALSAIGASVSVSSQPGNEPDG